MSLLLDGLNLVLISFLGSLIVSGLMTKNCVKSMLLLTKIFLEPLRIIVNAIGWNFEKKATLDEFF